MREGLIIHPFDLLQHSAMNAIKRRYSVRTYADRRLSVDDKDLLKDAIRIIKGPFSAEVRLMMIEDEKIAENTGGRIGTYGMIKGAKDFIAVLHKPGEGDMEQIGYMLELLILYAAHCGIGTCWLGGTFTRSEFAKHAGVETGEALPAITPIGYAAKKRVLESLTRLVIKADHRKPWEEIFFNRDFDCPLTKPEAGMYTDALEAVRLGPSASNKQPWRIVKSGEDFHFYLLENKGYSEITGFNMQRIDMGIAMCHFEIMLWEAGIPGRWMAENPGISTDRFETMSYIISWKASRSL